MESFKQVNKVFEEEEKMEGELEEKYKLEEIENLNKEVIKDTLQKQLENKLKSIDAELEKSQQKLGNVLVEIKRKETLALTPKNGTDLKILARDRMFHENQIN